MQTTNPRRRAKDALFDRLASIAGAMGSGRRAQIIEVLAQGERSVDEVASEIDQSLANTSHHLRTLARAGLVATRRSGTHVHYRLASDEVVSAWQAIRHLATSQVDDLDRLARDYLGDRDDLETITREELRDRLARGDVVVIDVRPTPEYEAGHVPGAISVPPDRLDDLLDMVAGSGAGPDGGLGGGSGAGPDGGSGSGDVVAYCRGPYCVYADDAVRLLRDAGRAAVRLEDGLPEWRLAGGEVEAGNDRP